MTVLDQNAARTRFLGETAQNFTNFSHFPVPALEMLDKQSSRQERTAITPIQYFEKSREAFIAMGLRDYFSTANFTSQTLQADLIQKAQALKQSCEGKSDMSQEQRLGIVFNLTVYQCLHNSEGVCVSAIKHVPYLKRNCGRKYVVSRLCNSYITECKFDLNGNTLILLDCKYWHAVCIYI